MDNASRNRVKVTYVLSSLDLYKGNRAGCILFDFREFILVQKLSLEVVQCRRVPYIYIFVLQRSVIPLPTTCTN